MSPTLVPDQAWALWRLESLLERRCAVTVGARTSVRFPDRLVHALDHAVLGAFRTTQELGLGEAARVVVRRYHEAGLACPGATLARAA